MPDELVVQSGHYINITGAAFAPDGRTVATCSADESVRLWDIGLGCEAGLLRGHQGPVYVLAFADGERLVSGGWDQTVRVWDVGARTCLRVLSGIQHGPIDSVAVSADGSVVAAASRGRQNVSAELVVWDAGTGDVRWSHTSERGYRAEAQPLVALSPGGDLLVFSEHEQGIGVLDLREPGGTPQVFLPGRSPRALAFAPDGLLAVGDDERVVLLEPRTGRETGRFSPGDPVRELTFLGPHRLAVHTATRTEVRSTTAPATVEAAVARASRAISPDGRVVAWVDDRHLVLGDLTSGRAIRRLGSRLRIPRQLGNLHRQFVLAACRVTPRLASAGPDGYIRIWDLRARAGPSSVLAHGSWVDGLAFSPDGSLLAAVGGDTIRVWRCAGSVPVLEIAESASEVEFSADGSAVVVLGGGRLRAFAVGSGEEIAAQEVGGSGFGGALAVSPWNHVAVMAGDELRIWDPFLTGEPVARVRLQASRALTFGNDGRILGGFGNSKWLGFTPGVQQGGALVLSLDGDALPLPGHATEVAAVAFSPYSDFVATGSEDGALMLWDSRTGERRFEVGAHAGSTSGVAFLSDGRFVASIGLDGAVRLWSVDSGEPAATLLSLNDLDYVVVTGTRHYSATKAGLSAIALRTGEGLVPFEQFDADLNRPDVVLEQLGYAPPDLVAAYAEAHGRRLARLRLTGEDARAGGPLPRVDLGCVPPPVSHDGVLRLWPKATPAGTPVARLMISVNDVPLHGRDGLPADAGAVDVSLSPGDNDVQVWAVDEDGRQSMRHGVRVFDARPEQPRVLYVLTVGVSAYQDSRYHLKYATKDAQDLAAELAGLGRRFERVETLVLPDATRADVHRAREFLGRSAPHDHVIMLFAGHGTLIGADFYFLPADFDPAAIPETALSYDEIEGLLDGIGARRRLVLLDCCHSGEDDGAAPDAAPLPAGVHAGRTFREVPVEAPGSGRGEPRRAPGINLREVFADLRQESGAFVIAAAGSAEFALETDDLRNGVFTATVIRALRESAESPRVTELAASVAAAVPALTGGRQQPVMLRENLEDDYRVL